MKATQKTLLTGALAISSVFAMNAQSNDNSDAKLLADVSLKNTETHKNDALNPTVREGGYVDAMDLSKDHGIMVVYISGAKGTADKPETYSAKQHAEILQQAFGNSKYTNNPTNIVVVYNETGEVGPSLANVLINGDEYKTKSGRTNFPPALVGKHIDVFADAYAKSKGIASYTQPSETSTQGIALNRN